MRHMQKHAQGFTLLELLMVVIIIAILASIALPQYMRVAERTRASEALTVTGAIRSSELRYRSQNPAGTYTTVLTELDIEGPGFGAPLSLMWTYAVSGAGAGSNAVATRLAGQNVGATVEVDMDGGASCSSDTDYSLPATPC